MSYLLFLDNHDKYKFRKVEVVSLTAVAFWQKRIELMGTFLAFLLPSYFYLSLLICLNFRKTTSTTSKKQTGTTEHQMTTTTTKAAGGRWIMESFSISFIFIILHHIIAWIASSIVFFMKYVQEHSYSFANSVRSTALWSVETNKLVSQLLYYVRCSKVLWT